MVIGATSSNSKLGGATPPPGIRKVNDSMWELCNPDGVPEAEIIFFHGLQLGDYENAFWKTWLARFDENVVWPKDWLGKVFPRARILAISYDSSARKNPRQLDMYCLTENLVSDVIMHRLNVGQMCPIIAVGHCLGGIVIKQFILCAERLKGENCRGDIRKSQKIDRFLQNIKGIFYYASPHGGFNKKVRWPGWTSSPGTSSEFLQLLLTNGMERERINDSFRKARENSNMRAYAIVENLPTNYLGTTAIVVDEESGRRDIDSYYTAIANHFDVCRPENMETSGIFGKLQGFIESILEEALQQGFENFQPIPKGAIGLDGSMEDVHQKLLGNHLVGIFGMGGIGKTTLGRAMFNKLNPEFEYSCFVPEVKLIPGRAQDVKNEVQNLMHHRGRKVEVVWSELRGKRLLLVLDDVDKDRDLAVISDIVDSIAPESRCIVTSRDKELLTSNDADCYEMPFLSKEHAKQLFISHAFSTPGEPPMQLLEKYMDGIVKKCDGLPLTLEVIGKYLKSKKNDERIWEQTLQALNDADPVAKLDEKLWKKLRVSYDGLGEPEQQMFLDATTFFSDGLSWTLREAKAAWSVIHRMEQLRWQTLVDLSLVYHLEEEDHHIKVHEQLKSMGRRIAGECKDGKRRWWKEEAGLEFLKSEDEPDDQQICSLRALADRGGYSTDVAIPRSRIGRMKKLQFLDVDQEFEHLTIDGAEENETLPTHNLVLLHCDGFRFFNPALCPRLAVLHLGNRFDPATPIGNLPSSFGRLSALKILTLDSFEGEVLPDEFGHLAQLQHLDFRRCRRLRTVPRTFGLLSRLQHLEFNRCDSLDTLPDSFGDLCALARLWFERCGNLNVFPESIKHLAALNHLYFFWCDNLRAVPEFLGQLSALQYVQFIGCANLQTLPSPPSFARLAKLHYLEITGSPKIDSLPFCTGHLPEALRHLKIGELDLKTIPDCVRSLPSLQILELKGAMSPGGIQLPLWLGGGVQDSKSSWYEEWFEDFNPVQTFHVRDGNFILQGVENSS